jgi:hypothetical protein
LGGILGIDLWRGFWPVVSNVVIHDNELLDRDARGQLLGILAWGCMGWTLYRALYLGRGILCLFVRFGYVVWIRIPIWTVIRMIVAALSGDYGGVS